jgi:hypothetical protein
MAEIGIVNVSRVSASYGCFLSGLGRQANVTILKKIQGGERLSCMAINEFQAQCLQRQGQRPTSKERQYLQPTVVAVS